MEIVYLIFIQLLVSIGILEFLPGMLGILTGIFFLILMGAILKERNTLFYIIPIIFFLRVYTGVSDKEITIGKKIDVVTRIFEGKGEILEIDGKYTRLKEYIIVSKIKDGKYNIKGEVYNINEGYKNFGKQYYIDIIENTEIEPNIFEKNMKLLVESRSQSKSYGEKNLYKALILGEKENLFKETKKLFLDTGLMHLLAISGLHMGIIVYILEKVFKGVSISKRWKNILILILISLYFFSIRITPSVQRAYIMVFIYLLGNIIYENPSIKKSFSIAFIISLLINPLIYKEPSFIMSYWAVFCIILFQPIMRNFKGGLNSYLVFTSYIQLAMLPLSYLIFGKISLISMVSSIILTPLGVIYIFLAFIGLILPISPVSTLVYNILIKGMEFFS